MFKKLMALLFLLAQITEINTGSGRMFRIYVDKHGCTHHLTETWHGSHDHTVDTIVSCPPNHKKNRKHNKRVEKQTTQTASRTFPEKSGHKKQSKNLSKK